MTPDECYKKDTGQEYPAYKKYIEISASADTEDGSDALLPPIQYIRNI